MITKKYLIIVIVLSIFVITDKVKAATHPNLLFSSNDIPTLQQKINDGVSRRFVNLERLSSERPRWTSELISIHLYN